MQNKIINCITKIYTQIACDSEIWQLQMFTVPNKVPQTHHELLSMTQATQSSNERHNIHTFQMRYIEILCFKDSGPCKNE